MWDPGFAHLGAIPALLQGWHRRFSLLSTVAWGSEAQPGLCAALHPGGAVWGRAIRFDGSARSEILGYLDAREGAYSRREVTLRVRDGKALVPLRAITYVSDPAQPRLRAGLGAAERDALIRQGTGARGTSLDYLRKTVAALVEDGQIAGDAHRILAMIDD